MPRRRHVTVYGWVASSREGVYGENAGSVNCSAETSSRQGRRQADARRLVQVVRWLCCVLVFGCSGGCPFLLRVRVRDVRANIPTEASSDSRICIVYCAALLWHLLPRLSKIACIEVHVNVVGVLQLHAAELL
jgi:hypothetical protein